MTQTSGTVPALSLPIKTRRLTIREYTEEDWPTVYAYVKDKAFWKFQAGEPPSEDRVKALFQWAVREQTIAPQVNYYLAATDAKNGDVIGEAVLKLIPPGHGQGEIGFGVSPALWKRGFATEITRTMVEAGFKTFRLHRISAQCAPENKASIRVMQKLGMAREGLLREHYRSGDRYWSSVIYAVLEQIQFSPDHIRRRRSSFRIRLR